MYISDFVNHCLSYVGLRLIRARKQPDIQHGNVYPLDANAQDGTSLEAKKILNLVAYTKTKRTTYSADSFPGGYTNLDVDGYRLKGQRDARARLEGVPFDFNGATVLDLGCNHGGMLRSIADVIATGVGVDYDHKLINVANRIRAQSEMFNLNFYVFDFDRENLDLLRNFYAGEGVDIVFLLSVCLWVKRWKLLIDTARSISDHLLFESNGSDEGQQAQEDYLRRSYATVTLVHDVSSDDALFKKRRLFLCRSA